MLGIARPQFREPWFGQIAGAYGEGDPGDLLWLIQRGGIICPTPTNIGVTVARLSFFRLPYALTVNKIRYYGVGITANVYRVALYEWNTLGAAHPRLTAELPLVTAADAFGSVGSGLNVTLGKDKLYFIACAVNATGTTAGLVAFGTTITATTGRILTAPNLLPGNLNPNAALVGYQAQATVVAGALPNPLLAASVVAQGLWVGGMPAFWLDNNNA